MFKKLKKTHQPSADSRQQTAGFTIIEVMIVLAIAGLILLIVFLAVPALQRNSRNTQRKSEISRVGSAVNNWTTDNNGAVFTAGGGNANLTSVINDAGTLNQYTLTAGTTFTVTTGTQAAMTTLANIRVVTGAQCGTSGATTSTSNTRQMVIQYALENSNGSGRALCQDV